MQKLIVTIAAVLAALLPGQSAFAAAGHPLRTDPPEPQRHAPRHAPRPLAPVSVSIDWRAWIATES